MRVPPRYQAKSSTRPDASKTCGSVRAGWSAQRFQAQRRCCCRAAGRRTLAARDTAPPACSILSPKLRSPRTRKSHVLWELWKIKCCLVCCKLATNMLFCLHRGRSLIEKFQGIKSAYVHFFVHNVVINR